MMSDRDAEFDAWLSEGDAGMLESLDAVVDTEENLLRLKQDAAKRAVTVAHASGSDEPDRAIRSVLASEIAKAANRDKPRQFILGVQTVRVTGRLRAAQGSPRRKRRRLLTLVLVELLLVVILSAGIAVLFVALGHGHDVTSGDRISATASFLSALAGAVSALTATVTLAMAVASRKQLLQARRQAELAQEVCELTRLSWTGCRLWAGWTNLLTCPERREARSLVEPADAVSTASTAGADPDSPDEAAQAEDACEDRVLCAVGGDRAATVQHTGHRRRSSHTLRRPRKRPPKRSG